jgi:lipopolysaccharide/colanic/teichoic acid biosynthesis glycosyltransferase
MEARQLAQPSPQTLEGAEPLYVRAARRMLDVAVALSVLILTAPLLLLLVAAIRIESRGPAIFRQRRLGRGQEPFTVNKLRTMHASADAAPHREYVAELIAGTAGRHSDGDRALFKLAVDERVTRLGRLLRRTSLDEVPQLWNVVRGEMSLVGPRPVVPYELEHYPGWYRERFAVKPGLTGLWQVSGRSERTYSEMVELDIEYVRRRSVGLDLLILLKTAWVVLSRRGVA